MGTTAPGNDGLECLRGLEQRIGEVQASPTSNTLLDRLKALLTGIVLAAGTAVIGKIRMVTATGDEVTDDTYDAVNTKESPPTAITNLASRTTNAATAVPVIVASTPCRSVHIVAKPANTGVVYVGGSDVSATKYTEILSPGDSMDKDISNANLLHFDVSVNGEGIFAGYDA